MVKEFSGGSPVFFSLALLLASQARPTSSKKWEGSGELHIQVVSHRNAIS